MKKIKEIARTIVSELAICSFNDVTDSSGYYVVREFADGTNRSVDVYKSDKDSHPHYVIYCSYEDEDFDYMYTKDLSVEQLASKLEEFYLAEPLPPCQNRGIKVFLGGTCSGYRWRNHLIPMLKCDYYNPIVKNWSEADRLREVKEREYADYVLYVITSGMKGVYSIAEIIDDSNKRPEKTIVCVLFEGINNQMAHSLKAVLNLAEANGATICSSLEEVAAYLNRAWEKENPTDTNQYGNASL